MLSSKSIISRIAAAKNVLRVVSETESLKTTAFRSQQSKVLDGKASSAALLNDLKHEITEIRKSDPSFNPGLAIVQVGNRPDSNVYIKHKLNAAEKIGMSAKRYEISSDITQDQLASVINDLNSDDNTHGIIVQLPLDTTQQIDTDHIIDLILPQKDVDGLTRENAGRLARGELDNTVIPCTPRGCLHLVNQTGFKVEGKRVVVLGRSKIVGGPAAALFTWNNGTTTICHSRTKDLAGMCKEADILVVAIGKAELVQKDWIKPGAVVIDCGINVLEGQGKGGKNKLVGDVHYAGASEIASWVTPVPGGVGPMTVAMLLKNTVDQAKRAKSEDVSN